MYEPSEDSELLAQAIKEHARGSFLDLGTGSGVLADTAHAMGLQVTAVDIDLAVVQALKSKPYRVLFSDRFSAVQGKFDTIVCNPPYLPNDVQGDEQDDRRLYGGKKGYEYIVQIIKEAKQHLTPDGQFLFLISTLTKPLVVEHALRQHGYAWEVVAETSLFMEKLFVYKATLLLGKPAELIGKGARSLVYRVDDIAVKISTPLRADKEAQMLRKVNPQGIGPRYVRHEDNKLFMELISGEPFDEYFLRTKDTMVMRNLLEQARILDELGIRKHELNRPGKNILVENGRIVLLDFERSIFQPDPNNVTQLAAWLAQILQRDIQEALVRYKRGDKTAFADIVAGLS
jgi:release factor glutamine methyltransferase